MKVKELMCTSVSWARPETSITQIAKQMRQDNVGAIPVCSDRGEPLGIVTDRDIVLRCVSTEEYPRKAKDVMTSHLVYAHPDMNIHEASLLFARYQVRRLPVVEAGRIVGIISLGDLAQKPFYVDEAGDALSGISKPSRLN